MKIFLAAIVLGLAVSARAQTQPWLEGQHSDIQKTLAVAVQDPQTWAALWHQHDASAPVPSLDFTKENVVAVFLGSVQTAGVKVVVVVQQDPLDANRLNVFYHSTFLKQGFAAQVQCAPYAMVKVRRAATIDVERDGGASIPERRIASAARSDAKVKALMQGARNPPFDGD